MPLTLRTRLGNTRYVDPDRIVYVQVERVRRRTPVIVADLADHVTNGYLVVETPENFGNSLLNTVANDEYEKAWFYVEGIKEWNEKERSKLARYESTKLKSEEEAKKAPLELVLDGLRRDGMPVGGMISAYRQQGFLYGNQVSNLLKLLEIRGFSDSDFLVDMEEILNGRGMIDETRTWKILTEQLNVRIPITDQPPEIELKEEPLLLKEFENVVLRAYNGQDLEGVTLTQQAWSGAGITPKEIYAKVNENVRHLNSQYMLVRVVGQSEENAGRLTLAELETDQKSGLRRRVLKPLRNNFQRPADIVDDAYALVLILDAIIRSYVSDDEEAVSVLKSENAPLLKRTIFERVIGKGPLISSFFLYVDGSTSGEETSKYEFWADKVNNAIEDNLLDNAAYKITNREFPVIGLVDTIRYLSYLLPEELYRLRFTKSIIDLTNEEISMFKKRQDTGYRPPSDVQFYDRVQSLHNRATNELERLTQRLGILAEGLGSWKPRFKMAEAVERLGTYELVYNMKS